MNRFLHSASLAATATALIALAPAAHAGDVALNYDDLSSLEEPLAIPLGNATLSLTGLVDAPLRLNLDADNVFESRDVSVTANFQAGLETQLSNRWTVGATYFGQYDERVDRYTDNMVGYVKTSWGTLIGGNISGFAREETRRRRGYGNAALGFDDFMGQIANWGGAYRLRTGPLSTTILVDEDGNFEVGTAFQRPLGMNDVRLTARARHAKVRNALGQRRFYSNGAGLVGELAYGSSLYDLGVGVERLQGQGLDLYRWFASGGARTKMGSWLLSAEGHYGEIEGQSEVAAAAGLGYTIARGMTANLGINYRDADVIVRGINVLNASEKSATASMRYSF